MFLFFSISEKEIVLNYDGKVSVHNCGNFGRPTVYMVFSVFSLFFIPIFKWNKKYFVKYSCCASVYELESNIGLEIENGNYVNINEDNLNKIYSDFSSSCSNCGASVDGRYSYCPHCGNKL